MRATLERLFQQQRAEGFGALRGTNVSGSVPVRDSLVNAALQDRIRSGKLPVKQGTIAFLGGGRVAVEATIKAFFLSPTVRLDLQFPASVDVTRDPVIRIGVSGPIAPLLPLVSAIGKLPEGVTIGGGQITADLRALLTQRGYADLLPYLRRLTFGGERGTLAIGFEVRID